MLLLAIPNVAEGRDHRFITSLVEAASVARVLDVHSDTIHNRTVLTMAAEPATLVEATSALAVLCTEIDMSTYAGAHPALGGLDVCPFVPHEADLASAIATAHHAARSIAEATGTPVYLYGDAARVPHRKQLPDIRRGGLPRLISNAADDPPDEGPPRVDPRRGAACVGARGPLIAFNVWLRCTGDAAARIARSVRASSGGLPGVRALALRMSEDRFQISMNLIAPEITGIDRAFDAVAAGALSEGAEVLATELVGLVPQRYLPDPEREAARRLGQPGRSVESALG